jgi:hypothetical protein
MEDIIKQINDLTREESLEAAQYLALTILEGKLAGEREKQFLQPFLEQPYANIEEIGQLARLLLLTAVLTDGYEEAVKSAIEGAGKKQLILGGTEIIALATIGLIALHTLLTRGKSGEDETIAIEEKDGKTTISIKRKTTYGISDSLGKMLKGYFSK